ncbi:MAG: LptF/LptG family permease [Muribaculaceae bacterium]|nr:LptF/LptG family permease [Muribaculaceae bacterium]
MAFSLRIKRLYTFVLQSFLPLFLMTFFICLFIVLMQFLWRYVDDLVGKGLELSVIGELFFYAALTMVPMALPLAVLLASLMTFGNLGERVELTAMKAAGVSLLKAMRPLIVLIILIAIGAFFFQNNVLPVAQTKMWTLLFSMRQKTPEAEIPEKVFYDQLPGLNIYVQHKDPESGMLYDVMIYDISRGFENSRILIADSGKMAVTEDQSHIYLQLHHGSQFENLRESTGQNNAADMPYRREQFDEKSIIVAFDTSFSRMDESGMRNQYVGKNIKELQATIDSLNVKVDSAGYMQGRALVEMPILGIDYYKRVMVEGELVNEINPPITLVEPLDLDSLVNVAQGTMARTYYNQAISKAKRLQQTYEFDRLTMDDTRKNIRRHAIEMHKKFTLSFACIIFFFIGAPLGAIIRKGGLGMPLIISVFLFIVYYIIDNTGYKMAREGRIEVWEGMWLSSAVLLPLGIFFTYKAMRDSAVFNKDAYLNFFNRLLGIRPPRHYEVKEFSIDDVDNVTGREMIADLDAEASVALDALKRRLGYLGYLRRGIMPGVLEQLDSKLEGTISYLSNSKSQLVVNKISDYPTLPHLWLLRPFSHNWSALTAAIFFPLGFTLWIMALRERKELRREIQLIRNINQQLLGIFDNTQEQLDATQDNSINFNSEQEND